MHPSGQHTPSIKDRRVTTSALGNAEGHTGKRFGRGRDGGPLLAASVIRAVWAGGCARPRVRLGPCRKAGELKT